MIAQDKQKHVAHFNSLLEVNSCFAMRCGHMFFLTDRSPRRLMMEFGI